VEVDPVFFSLGVGLLLSVSMTLDERLFGSTRKRTLALTLAYLAGLIFLYNPYACLPENTAYRETICRLVIISRQNLANVIGVDMINAIWLATGVVSFTINFSGTESVRWKRFAKYLFVGFIIMLFLVILPSRLD